MDLVYIDNYEQIGRFSLKQNFKYCSFDPYTIYCLNKVNVPYIDLLNLDCVKGWASLSCDDLASSEDLSRLLGQYDFSKGYDLRLFAVTVKRAREIACEIVVKEKFESFIICDSRLVAIHRTGPHPFDKAINKMVPHIMADYFEEVGVKIKLQNSYRSKISDFFYYIKSQRVKLNYVIPYFRSKSSTIVISSLLYPKEIEIVRSFKNKIDITSLEQLFFWNGFIYRLRSRRIVNQFPITFYGIRTTAILKKLMGLLIEEELKASLLYYKFKDRKALFLGHDGFALESRLCQLFQNSNTEVVSFPHYGIGFKLSFEKVANQYSKKVLWNNEMKHYIDSSAGLYPTDEVFGTDRYSIKRPQSLFQYVPSNVKILLITASPNLGLYDFTIRPVDLIRNFLVFIAVVESLNWSVRVRNHPSYDFHEFYLKASKEYNFVLEKNVSLESSLDFCDICVLFICPSSVLIDAVLSGRLVVLFFPNEFMRSLDDININLEHFPVFRTVKSLVDYVSKVTNSVYTDVCRYQYLEVMNFIGKNSG